MIASLQGSLLSKSVNSIILDVHGVGYDVQVSTRTLQGLPQENEHMRLFIHTAVREDAITLYGFIDTLEKELFLLLNTVSGVGPKLALAILSGMAPDALCAAIAAKDLSRLVTLSGVGKKTAQRLCVELGEKVRDLAAFAAQSETGNGNQDLGARGGDGAAPLAVEGFVLQDAVSGLVNLGYSETMAWQAVRSVQQQYPDQAGSMELETLLRHALQALARV